MDDPIEDYYKAFKKISVTPFSKGINLIESDELLKSCFRFNLLSQEVEFIKVVPWDNDVVIGSPLRDIDLIQLKAYLTKKYNFTLSCNLIHEIVIHDALKQAYHPIKDYIKKLEWDGTRRLDHWLQSICGVQENVYTRAISRKVLVAAVSRVFIPGCKYDCMLILEGKQGIKKSTLIETLAGGRKFYTVFSFNQTTKELAESMRGKWFIEVAELHGFNRQEAARIKNLLSDSTPRVRMSYERTATDFPKQNIFIGTINPDGDNQYFNDPTGSRRFWPVECTDTIDINHLSDIRDQLFAEAYQHFLKGEQLYLDNLTSLAIAEEEQEARMIIDPWTNVVGKYLDNKLTSEINPKVTVDELMKECLKISEEKMDLGKSIKLGRLLKKKGWVQGKQKNIRFWCPTREEVDNIQWEP